MREQGGDETFRDVRIIAAQEPRGCRDERLLGAQFIPAGKLSGKTIGLAGRVATIHHQHHNISTARWSQHGATSFSTAAPRLPTRCRSRFLGGRGSPPL